MLTTVEGIYRNGRVELTEQPPNMDEEVRVIVTFVRSNEIDLASVGIDQVQAQALQTSLATFADDWNSPEMNIYNDYDAAKANH
jgi:hypothetical protein